MDIKRIVSSERHWVVDLFNKYRVFYQQPSDKPLADDFIKQRLENNESIIFVAIEQENGNDIPIGFAQLYPGFSSVGANKYWILNDLYVDDEYRRKGTGEKLVRAAIAFAKDGKGNFMQLETAVDNYSAQRLYESTGFRKQRPDPDFFVYRIDLTN